MILVSEKERHTIPRWNSLKMAGKLGELSPTQTGHTNLLLSQDTVLSSLLMDWKTERNLPLAVEIISTANLAHSKEDISDVILYAQKAIANISDVPSLLKDLIYDVEDNAVYPTDSHQICISKIKESLIKYPRNPLLWSELSREYITLGQQEQGRKAIHVAYGLAPNNRTILRAIARFYNHLGDPETALSFLRKSPLLKNDPWILSSEIAISNSIGKTSKSIKYGQNMLVDTANNPLSISELASELATMDFFAGKSKFGKRKLEIAIGQPFENAVAQIVWINKNMYNVESIIERIPQNVDCNYEAGTQWFFNAQDWHKAQRLSGLWQEYQPFSSKPALISSFISTDFLLDYQKAKETLLSGLKSNPHNKNLMNNYIYALTLNGDLDEAQQWYLRAKSAVTDENYIPLIATGGLLFYRLGNVQQGKEYYQKAINIAQKGDNQDLLFRAILCFAREEKRAGNSITELLAQIQNSKYTALREQYDIIIKNFGLN